MTNKRFPFIPKLNLHGYDAQILADESGNTLAEINAMSKRDQASLWLITREEIVDTGSTFHLQIIGMYLDRLRELEK